MINHRGYRPLYYRMYATSHTSSDGAEYSMEFDWVLFDETVVGSQVTDRLVESHTEGRIGIIRMVNTRKRNALSLGMLKQLRESVESHMADDDVRVLLLEAEGSVWSSGHDLKELQRGDKADADKIFSFCSDLMMRIQTMPKPLIASVGGLATAAGCQLVASADLVVASHNAAFATPGVRVGLFCSTPSVPLCRTVPRQTALRMLYTGGELKSSTDVVSLVAAFRAFVCERSSCRWPCCRGDRWRRWF